MAVEEENQGLMADESKIDQPKGDGSVLMNYEPTVQEKAKYAISDFLSGGDDGDGLYSKISDVVGNLTGLDISMDRYEANKLSEKLMGNPNATDGSYGMGLADITPAGLIFGADNAKDSFVRARNTDDKLGMGLAVGEGLLSAAEAFPLTKGLAKAGKRGLEKLADVAENIDPNTLGMSGGNIFSTKTSDINLPPAANAQKTQIAGTLPTYEKADGILNEVAPDQPTLDFGAGLGLSQKKLGYDTYEPFPREGFDPTFMSASEIPDGSYSRITSFNVLNVVPREMRDEIVQDIGRVLKSDGVALITTRGRDVMTAKGKPGSEPMSQITSIGTYQKGFTQAELQEYITETLGEGFEVTRLKLGPAGVQIKKVASQPDTSTAQAVLDIRASQMDLATRDRIQPSGENPLFDLSPESYTKTLPEQKPTYVPRQDAGTNKPLPGNDRGRPVSEAMDKIADRLAERMRPWLGTEAQYFYHTGPIVDKAISMGFKKEEIYDWMKEFAEAYAATSPRTETAQNIRNATLVITKRQLGLDLDDIVGPGGTGINERGYPMMIGRKGELAPNKQGKLVPLKADGIHRKLKEDVDAGGINPDTNPKPATFAENVYGNLDGVTVDTHAVRGALDAMNEIQPGSIPIDFIKKEYRDQYKADPLSLNPANMIDDSIKSQTTKGQSKQVEYAVFSDIYRLTAEKLGVSPAEAQSMGWFGSGDSTGLASELKSVARLLDERIDVTAQAMNESKESVFKKLLNKEIPVLSLFGAATGAGLMSDGQDEPELARGGFLDNSESEKGIMSIEGQSMADEKFRLDRAKADLNNDGELSSYEMARGEAVQKATKNQEIEELAFGGAVGMDAADEEGISSEEGLSEEADATPDVTAEENEDNDDEDKEDEKSSFKDFGIRAIAALASSAIGLGPMAGIMASSAIMGKNPLEKANEKISNLFGIDPKETPDSFGIDPDSQNPEFGMNSPFGGLAEDEEEEIRRKKYMQENSTMTDYNEPKELFLGGLLGAALKDGDKDPKDMMGGLLGLLAGGNPASGVAGVLVGDKYNDDIKDGLKKFLTKDLDKDDMAPLLSLLSNKFAEGGYLDGSENSKTMEAYHGGMPCGCEGECDGSCGGEGMMPGSYYDTEEETGNPVPVGSLPEEVADDVSALLSEGEYVIPADVVRWHGLKHIQDMMVEAKSGLMSMDMMGQLHDTGDSDEEYEEEQGEEEEYETPEGNDVEVASVDTEEEVLEEDDEEEEATTVSYAFKSTPKVAFIR